jgi:hypothetical protein
MNVLRNTADVSLIRQYLLGRLDAQPNLEEKLSNDILSNDEMSEVVDAIEDEILEEYLDGSLDSADRQAVESYFLRPHARQQKLRFAKVLRRHFDTKADGVADFEPSFGMPAPSQSHLKSYGQFALLLLVCVFSVIYIAGLRRDNARLHAELARRQQQTAAGLPQQTAQLESTMVPLALVADRSRGASQRIPRIEITPSTQRLIVEIALQGAASDPYDIRLETKSGEGPLWSARLLPLVSNSGDARLVFDVPAGKINSDVYSFAVSPLRANGERHYDFEVKRQP